VGAISRGYAANGKRRRPKVYGKTKTEVRDKLKELKKELETGVKSDARYTVADAVNDWLTKGLKGRSKKTVDKYRSLAANHVVSAIGRARLRDLTADDVDDWLEPEAKKLSTRSVKETHSILRRSIAQAQRRDKVARNVADLVTPPDGTAGRPSTALSFDQAAEVLKAARTSRLHAYVVLSLLVGMRTEEARALKWEHLALDRDGDMPPHVMVWRSVREHGDTKTKKSRRTLALPAHVVAVLKAHRGRQAAERERAAGKWHDNGLVFCTKYGTELDAGNVRRAFRLVLRDAGLPEDGWTPREMRHSFVSMLSARRVPVEVIADLVGHSGTSVTERVYRMQLRPVITEGAEIMDDIFKADDGPAEGEGSGS
jgi:integrase